MVGDLRPVKAPVGPSHAQRFSADVERHRKQRCELSTPGRPAPGCALVRPVQYAGVSGAVIVL